MTKLLVAAALTLAATLAQPATAVTFPTLTTIYVGSGVYDSGDSTNAGVATVVSCSNVSGQSANVRFLVLSAAGSAAGNQTLNLQHGRSAVVATHGAVSYSEVAALGTGSLEEGAVLNIESTQSGVFCTAAIVNAAGFAHEGSPLHLVRINGHPGAEE